MTSRIHRTRCFALFAALCLIGPGVQGQVTDIGLLPGGTTCSGVAINNSGTAVAHCGDSQGRTLTVRKPLGQAFQTLLTTSQNTCRAVGINTQNTVSANCRNDAGEFVPLRWLANLQRYTLTPIPGLLGLLPDVAATGGAINDSDWIIGTSISPNGQIRPVIWPGGQTAPEMLPLMTALTHGGLDAVTCEPVALDNTTVAFNGPLVAGTCSVSANGTVRSRAVLWRRTGNGGSYAVTVLDALANADSNCSAVAIEDGGGAVAGTCTGTNDEPQAVYWAAGGTAVQSIVPSIPGGSARSTVAAMVGNLVVGSFRTSSGFEHGYAWQAPNLSFADIGVLPGGFNSRAVGILTGAIVPIVVGVSEVGGGASHAFSWGIGQLFDGGTLGGPSSRVTGVGGGRLIGTSHVANGHEHAFIGP